METFLRHTSQTSSIEVTETPRHRDEGDYQTFHSPLRFSSTFLIDYQYLTKYPCITIDNFLKVFNNQL